MQELRVAKKSSADEQLEVLQQKLTAVEHREGEALQSLEQLRSAVADLNIMWKRHLEVIYRTKYTDTHARARVGMGWLWILYITQVWVSARVFLREI